MLGKVLNKVFGSKNERDIKKTDPLIASINALEPEMEKLGDEDLKGLTIKFKERLKAGEKLDDILPEAFAAVREVSRRKLGMRHFDVQLIGGYVLHQGKIAEMKTGEGKTLMATLPLYLNALTERGAHLVTVNDYLAKRDARWMAPIYHGLGMSVAIMGHDVSFLYDPASMSEDESLFQLSYITRTEAYEADITYATNNELGFDYLRDNMKFSIDDYVQRELNFAIVDEVDSILIDEARTPLIISGPTEDSTDKYYLVDAIIPGLQKEEHYTVDEKANQVFLTEDGVTRVEELLKIENLYDPKNLELLHHVNQAVRAHSLYEKDVAYVVKDGKVIIVDEFTGRLMSGRRWGDGLHQAVEAKEKVRIESENQTLATITFQNYFRMYDKLAGMTGTANTEAQEFYNIYKLEVVVIPTNKPMVRLDSQDLIYRTETEKFNAVVDDIIEQQSSGRPALVGTISIENSEKLSRHLKKRGVSHKVLNAKHHESEAEIVAQAGRKSSVTIATNMAGRGTDIVLGGNPAYLTMSKAGHDDTTDAYKEAFEGFTVQCDKEKEEVLNAGGLYILGTERHDSRRIDNQLRGRSGRQGDPGESRFYISLEDDLMRIFASERISNIMGKLGMEEGVPIEHGLVSKAIENAQKKVEGKNFDIRKHLLEYDDVMNKQREVVYGYRRQILSEKSLAVMVASFTEESIAGLVELHIGEIKHVEEWDLKPVADGMAKMLGIDLDECDITLVKKTDDLVKIINDRASVVFKEKIVTIGEEVFLEFERMMMLHTIDNLWKDHLLSMDHLKSGIGLRGYGQKNPLNEYKQEGFDLFSDMIFRFKSEVVERLFRVQIEQRDIEEASSEATDEGSDAVPATGESGVKEVSSAAAPFMPKPTEQKMSLNRGEDAPSGEEKSKPIVNAAKKVGRNDPCPCGSGKKYKKCCGK